MSLFSCSKNEDSRSRIDHILLVKNHIATKREEVIKRKGVYVNLGDENRTDTIDDTLEFIKKTANILNYDLYLEPSLDDVEVFRIYVMDLKNPEATSSDIFFEMFYAILPRNLRFCETE